MKIKETLALHWQSVYAQAGVEKLSNLRVLYLSNNKVKDFSEIERLSSLDKLEELLLIGNPIFNEFKDSNNTANYRIEVCCHFDVQVCLDRPDRSGVWKVSSI